MKKRTLKIIGITIPVLIGIVFTFAKIKRITPLSWHHSSINQPMFSNQAINGYDAVAYLTQNSAIKGEESFSHNWNDAIWFFQNKENKNAFIENPEKYAPQYGGFCAFSVSKGFTANTNPNSFKIIDGKIYLFADDDVKSEWLNHKDENLKIGNENWK